MDVCCNKPHNKCARTEKCVTACDDSACFVSCGPSSTGLFQGSQNEYIRPASQTLSKLHSNGCCLSLLVGSEGAVEGVRVESEGLYNVDVSALLEGFSSNSTSARTSVAAIEDVRVFIDDSKFATPLSAYGQTMQVNAPLLGESAVQNPSLGYSAGIYLKKHQTLHFGFLYTSAQEDNYFRLTFSWNVVKVGKDSCNRLKRVSVDRDISPP